MPQLSDSLPSRIRLILLHLLCLSIVLTLGKIVLDPTAGKRPFAAFNFPNTIPLAGWDALASQPLVNRALVTSEYNQVSAGRQYEYRQNHLSLHTEIHYVLNTDGDVIKLLQQQSNVGMISEARTISTKSGFYYSFMAQGQLHLTSCVNPRGSDTVTAAQFFHNRYTYDFQPNRLLAWGLGQENLIDQRCLWLHLQTPLQQEYNQSLSILEAAWRGLTAWGQAQFPQP